MLKKIINALRRLKAIIIKKLRECDVTLSPGDYLYIRDGQVKYYHFIIGVRIIDIEKWKSSKKASFVYTNMLSLAYDKDHDTALDDSRFISLLESIEKTGYDNNSKLGISKDFVVNDGTHRAALAWCNGFIQLPGHLSTAPSFFNCSIPKHIENDAGFQKYSQFVYNRIKQIQDELKEKGYTLCCRAKGLSNTQLAGLEKELLSICKLVGRYRREKDNDTLYTLLPQTFDYYRRGDRLSFKSVSTLNNRIRKKYIGVILTDNFVDGKILFDHFNIENK